MISAILAMAIGQYPVKTSILELPDPTADHVTIHAYLWRDKNYVKEEQSWRLICSIIGINSLTYNNGDVDYFGGTAGVRPQFVSGPDFIRVEIVSQPEKWREGLTLAASLIAQPNWRANQWEEKEKVLAGTKLDPWRSSLWPMPEWKETLLEGDAANTHSRILDVSGLRIVVAGPIEVGQAKEELDKTMRGWTVPEYQRVPRYAEETALPEKQVLGVTTYEMSGKPIRVGEQGAAAEFLAAVALGVGKGSSIWETVREKEGLAYVAEGLFWPTRQGFVPRLLMLRRSEESELIHAGTMAEGLAKSVEGYTVIELERAKSMASQILLHPTAFRSVYVDSENTLYGNPDDDVRWRGLLNGMGLPSIPLSRWDEMVRDVTLEEFQAAAQRVLEGCSMRVARGIPALGGE